MKYREPTLTFVEMSPPAAATEVGSTVLKGGMLQNADLLVIDASLTAGAGGTLDVYLQRKLGPDRWVDWIHFPQLTAGQSKKYSIAVDGRNSDIVEVGGGTDAAPGVGLAAGAIVPVMPGGDVRAVFVAGAGTSAGAENRIEITPYTVQA